MVFHIYSLTSANISGVMEPASTGSGPCGGKYLWVLTPSGGWDMESFTQGCNSKNGGKIYSEFRAQCTDDKGNLINNPNGSVKSLAN